MWDRHKYIVEPTGADSPSQNGGVESANGVLAVMVRALLYGAGLPAKYWSMALLHAGYLLDRRVHSVTKKTPFEAWYGVKPDLKHLRTFGARVCVKRTGKRRAKLDRHDFTGIFLGYTATDQNIWYIDVKSGLVKDCHHAIFDEAWYLQPSRPPAAQLLYDLGLSTSYDTTMPPEPPTPTPSPYPPLFLPTKPFSIDTAPAKQTHLPLRLYEDPLMVVNPDYAAAAARVSQQDPYQGTILESKNESGMAVEQYDISRRDLEQVYFSPHPYEAAFEDTLNLRRLCTDRHPTAGMDLQVINGCLIVEGMRPSSPAAKIPRWRSRIRNAWLRQVGDTVVSTEEDVTRALNALLHTGVRTCQLIFSHPAVKHGLTNDGIPQVNLDQLNPRRMFHEFATAGMPDNDAVVAKWDGEVFNWVSKAMKLTRSKLKKSDDWTDWQQSKYTQLDQYI